jgi:hypothetical protein
VPYVETYRHLIKYLIALTNVLPSGVGEENNDSLQSNSLDDGRELWSTFQPVSSVTTIIIRACKADISKAYEGTLVGRLADGAPFFIG